MGCNGAYAYVCAPQVLQTLFDEIDEDSDGGLDRREIAKVFERTGMTVDEAQLTSVIAEMDVDSNEKARYVEGA